MAPIWTIRGQPPRSCDHPPSCFFVLQTLQATSTLQPPRGQTVLPAIGTHCSVTPLVLAFYKVMSLSGTVGYLPAIGNGNLDFLQPSPVPTSKQSRAVVFSLVCRSSNCLPSPALALPCAVKHLILSALCAPLYIRLLVYSATNSPIRVTSIRIWRVICLFLSKRSLLCFARLAAEATLSYSELLLCLGSCMA